MWFHKDQDAPWKGGLKQATSVFAYVIVFTQLMANGGKLFPNMDNKNLVPVMFLTLFCFSVLACGLMVFYKPYMLFVDKKSKEAMKLVLYTTKWLGIFAVLTIVVVATLSR